MTETPLWPIFVVSLADNLHRRASIKARLDELGLAFEFIDAIDGRNGLPDDIMALVDQDKAQREFGRRLALTEIACAMSHRKVYQRIIDEGLGGALVFEDDAILSDHVPTFYHARRYEQTDLLQLNYWTARVFRFGWRKMFDGHRAARVTTPPFMAVAYTISARGARHIYDNTLPLCAHADWPCETGSIDHRVMIPMITEHPKGPEDKSDIAPQRLAEIKNAGDPTPKKQRQSLKRIFKRGYWRAWVIKRLSRYVTEA